MIRNYPQMKIDLIRDKVINGLKIKMTIDNGNYPHIHYKFMYDNKYQESK